MPKLKYVGPHDAVDIPSLGLLDVKRGDSIDVDDKDAAENLAAQSENWEAVKPPKKSTKKAEPGSDNEGQGQA
jgi:hypothetical protein